MVNSPIRTVIFEWLQQECGLNNGSKPLCVEINGEIVQRLVNVFLYEEYIYFNDVNGAYHHLDYGNSRFFEIMKKLTNTGWV